MEYKWEKEHTEKLILFVQENACLYSVKSVEFMDRIKKAKAFNEIQKKLQKDMENVTVEDIKKKWKNLRGQYMREKREIKSSKKSGSGISDMYQPKLWCFNQLRFLEAHCAIRESQDNIQTDNWNKSVTASMKKNNQFAQMHYNFSVFQDLITKRKNPRKYSWLGTLVVGRMEEINVEQQQKAAWEIQTVIQKYIYISQKQCSVSTSPSTAKDLLQLSMNDVFEESDFIQITGLPENNNKAIQKLDEQSKELNEQDNDLSFETIYF